MEKHRINKTFIGEKSIRMFIMSMQYNVIYFNNQIKIMYAKYSWNHEEE